jgi:hypothetical protein
MRLHLHLFLYLITHAHDVAGGTVGGGSVGRRNEEEDVEDELVNQFNNTINISKCCHVNDWVVNR